MTNGLITDTVLNAAEQAVSGLGGVAFINLMFVAVPAAVVPHPVVVGPRDRGDADHGAAGVASPTFRAQLVVTAYQSANGLLNLITPTSAVVMGGLAIARVGYGTWLKFVWPLLILLAVLCVVVLSVGVLLQ